MADAYASGQNYNVMSYIDKLVTDVTKDLNANKVRLLSCHPKERAHIKCKIKSQFAVLEYLQGNRTKNSKIQLWIEIHTLKTKIKISENQERQNADKLCANWKVIDDLRMQLRQSQRKERENAAAAERVVRELGCQLREQLEMVQMMKEQFLRHVPDVPSIRPDEEHVIASDMEEKLQAVKVALRRMRDATRAADRDSNGAPSLSEQDRHQKTETSVSQGCPLGSSSARETSKKNWWQRLCPCYRSTWGL